MPGTVETGVEQITMQTTVPGMLILTLTLCS